MTYVFVVLLAVHMGHALLANRGAAPGQTRLTYLLLLTQTPLFLMACYFGFQHDVFSRQLVSPAYIGAGLLVGHLIFAASLLATHRSLSDAGSHLFDFGGLWRFSVDNPIVLYRFISVAVAEELIWRVAAQPLAIAWTGNATLGVILVAVAFSVVHKHFFQNSLGVSLEFLGFSLALGALYHWTGSLILVIVIHAVRDIEIAYLEYVIKVDELGDEEAAVREIENQYMPQRTELT